MNTSPRSIFRRLNVLQALLTLLLAFLFQACSKESFVSSPISTPIPGPSPIIPSIRLYPIQNPFKTFVAKYNVPFTATDSAIGLSSGDFGEETRNGMIYNQAELGFVFRSSVSGVVEGLGVMLPASGFIHTVTLWDSATQTVLGSLRITSPSSGGFSYVDFGTSIAIRANQGYVVGFNTLAVGNPINSYSPGNSFFLVDGIYVDGGLGSDLPIFPFTEGNLTIENGFTYRYGDGAPPANLFPPSTAWNDQPNGFFGLCDVSFVQ